MYIFTYRNILMSKLIKELDKRFEEGFISKNTKEILQSTATHQSAFMTKHGTNTQKLQGD